MDAIIIDTIHSEYKDYYADFRLMRSCSVFIPFYRVNLTMEFTYESKLDFLEEFICRCIAEGITTAAEINDVLAIDDKISRYAIDQLLRNNYLTVSGLHYALSSEGEQLFNALLKHENSRKSLVWFYDGLNPEYKIEFFGEHTEHRFVKFRNREMEGNLILPETFPDYDESRDYHQMSQRVLQFIADNHTNQREKLLDGKTPLKINNFELSPEREVLYHEYLMIVFQNAEGAYRLLAYDPCGLEGIDQRVTQTLQLLMENKSLKLMDQMPPSPQSDLRTIIHALKNYASSSTGGLDEEARNTSVEMLNNASPNITSRYIMNYEIRTKFLEYIKTATQSLYIISPWMNVHIVNNEFMNDLGGLLKRGVKVFIIYGIGAPGDQDVRNLKTHVLADKLRQLGEQYSGLLHISHGHTHEKLLICDMKYYINGSFNFLSYSGEDENFFRNEGSTYSEDPILINETVRLRFSQLE